MAEAEEIFPIFILTMMALPLVPYTIVRLCRAYSTKKSSIHCQCSACSRSGKYRKSIFKRISSFSTCSNLTLAILWVIMGILVYYIKNISRESQSFDPFSILGLEPGAPDSEIKKSYRRLSILYHPDKNSDPEAHKYFVDHISKAYQALTDPVARENFEIYGHPDGHQGLRLGFALPEFLLHFDGASSGLLLVGIVGVCILLPLMIPVIYLSRSSKYTGKHVMHQTLSTYYHFMKPSLAPSKVMDVFIKAAEYTEMPVRRSDEEPLQKLFVAVKSELNLDHKNKKTEQAKFWKQHPSLVKTELLIQAHLTRRSALVSPSLQSDYKQMLELAPRLLEELLTMALIPRSSQGRGWLRPAIGAVELSQCIIQAVPFPARKAIGGNSEGIAPFLQLPRFSERIVRKIGQKKVHTLQELQDMTVEDRTDLLTRVAGLSPSEAHDIETVLDMIPSIAVDVACETDGEEAIQEGDVVTMYAWVSLHRKNALIGALPHCPHYPFYKEENFWLLLADPASNEVWVSQRVSFMNEAAAVAATSNAIYEIKESLGASVKEINAAVKEAVDKVKAGFRLVVDKFRAPSEGNYNLSSYCFCDAWIGCDAKTSLKLKVLKKSRVGTRKCVAEGEAYDDKDGIIEESEDEEGEAYEDDCESEYSDGNNEENEKDEKGKFGKGV